MKIILLTALCSISLLSIGQTDIIEMRSRGASIKKYERISSTEESDHIHSNFGMAPMPEIETAVLDSIKVLSDSTAVVYTSNYCRRGGPVLMFSPIFQDSLGNEINEPVRQYSNPRLGRLWQPGADTVLNHPIFTQRHSLDSVKGIIDRDYNFNLPSDSIEFIGFDNSNHVITEPKRKTKRKSKQKKNGIGWELLMMLAIPISILWVFGKYLFPSPSH